MQRTTIALAAGLATLAAAIPASASAARLVTYPVTIDVSLRLTATASFNSIRGCDAPTEKASMTYTWDYESDLPGNARKPGRATATLVPGVAGTTPSRGERGGARERGRAGQWDLQVGWPSGCNISSPPPPVPPWATSPTCHAVAGRLDATLVQDKVAAKLGDDDLEPLGHDGVLLLRRVGGGDVGASCNRFLTGSLGSRNRGAALAHGRTTTLLIVPVKNLSGKLLRLTAGGARSRPSTTLSFSMSGRCDHYAATPDIGTTDEEAPAVPTPLQAVGSDPSYGCTVSGRGVAVVRRVGPTQRTTLPKVPKTGT